MKILIAYDGSLNSQIALKYGIQKVREDGGEIEVIHVFNKNLFIDYDAHIDAEKMARMESSRYVEDAKRIVAELGSTIKARVVVREGNPEEEITAYAEDENIDLIVSPPKYKSIAKSASCPVSVVPGFILVPVDNTDSTMKVMAKVAKEAQATSSKVILLGIIPIHMYNKWEKREIENIKRETSSMVKKAEKMLAGEKIEVKAILRSGYPDEEIMKAADEYPVSLIIIPEGGNTPSELGKAATMIIDEQDKFRKRVILA